MQFHLEKDNAIVRLDSEVDQLSILALCDAKDLCIDYYVYAIRGGSKK